MHYGLDFENFVNKKYVDFVLDCYGNLKFHNLVCVPAGALAGTLMIKVMVVVENLVRDMAESHCHRSNYLLYKLPLHFFERGLMVATTFRCNLD
jgi:hypothetical protein